MRLDAELLRRYAEAGEQEAFTELVRRHLRLVYFAALRRTFGNAALSQEIAQSVFTAAAKRARELSVHGCLAGWLYTTTRQMAERAVRKERNRRRYEEEATVLALTLEENSPQWDQAWPVIERALEEMSQGERELILLRFFEHRSFAEIGASLAISEDAARMRVERALEKMRKQLGHRGIYSAAAALAVTLSVPGTAAMPAGLAATVSGAALASTAALSGAATFLGSMSTLKLAAVVTTAAAILASGVAVLERNRAKSAETRLAVINQERNSLRAAMAEAERRLAHVQALAQEADRDSAKLLAAVEASRRPAAPEVRRRGSRPAAERADPLTDSLETMFPNGIVATVGDRVITVDEIRRELAPRVSQLVVDVRDPDEFSRQLHFLQNVAVKNAVERVLLIQAFNRQPVNGAPRQVSPEFVDRALSDQLREQFGSDQAKFSAFLESRGLTPEQHRREVEEAIAYRFMQRQQRKWEASAGAK